MDANAINDNTIMTGVECKKCGKTLPPHSVKTHLEDPNNSIFKCPSHKKTPQPGFKWGQELQKWKAAYEELQKENEELKEEIETLEHDARYNAENGAREAYRAAYAEVEKEFQSQIDDLRDELAEIKENRFPCDVYWSATNGEITLYKIPNDVACLNNTDGDNAVLDAFQNGYFGEEWGSYSKLEVVEMTREMLEEHIGELVEREEEPDNISVPITSALQHKILSAHLEPESENEEEPTPKSTKDLVIDQLNEEPHPPAFEPIPEGHKQIVVGTYYIEFTWEVPAGINLNDTETYEFWDRWGCLRIRNKITDEMTEVEEHDETDDFKEANDLELHLLDADGCRV